jgi:hypothetical protein
MGAAHRARKARFVLRHENQMYVIWHQAICPDLHAQPAGILGEQTAINLLIAGFEKDRPAPVAALRHMMRQSWNDDAGKAGHGIAAWSAKRA